MATYPLLLFLTLRIAAPIFCPYPHLYTLLLGRSHGPLMISSIDALCGLRFTHTIFAL